MDRERIGKYKILGKLGQGTMGEVFKALDPTLNREVAIKAVSLRADPDDESIQRFHREAQAAALLNHPNIVTVYDYGKEDGILYMAMELLEGSDLRQAIDNDELETLEHKLVVMEGVLSALDYAHERGVVHRDVKPANIHLGPGSPGGQVKIMDFGLARVHTSDMTQDGIVLGTPNYMSPEQALGDQVDGRSDLFSAGAVLYELLTSHKPFEADSTPSVLFQVVHREPPPVRRWAPDVPTPFVEVVDRALAKDRDTRFASAAEMRAALQSARGALPSAPAVTPDESARGPASSQRRGPSPSQSLRGRRAPRRRRFAVPTLAAAAAVALVAALFLAGPRVRDWLGSAGQPGGDSAQVDELTRALVATQVQLAQRELDDKNWQAAAAQARSAVGLAPDHAVARQVLQTAELRLVELDDAIAATRKELAAENTEAASEQLSFVLELDPRHPAAAELSARLNAVFRGRADDAATSTRAAREGAAAGGAAGSRGFRDADAAGARAEDLMATGEFADAARVYLEARDGFDRAGRDARERQAAARAAATPTPAAPPPPEVPEPAVRPPIRDARQPKPAPPLAPTPAELARSEPTGPPIPEVPARRFISGGTTITTPTAGGELAGFESADVTTMRPPRFQGKLVFEMEPAEVRPGDPFLVRVHLVNEGRRSVRVDGLEITTVIDGERSTSSAPLAEDRVPARGRALVGEHAAVWAAAGTWSLVAEAAVEGDERVRSRLTSE